MYSRVHYKGRARSRPGFGRVPHRGPVGGRAGMEWEKEGEGRRKRGGGIINYEFLLYRCEIRA